MRLPAAKLGLKAIAATVAVVVVVACVLHFSGDVLLNRYVRPKLERTFAAHHPGSSLRLGSLRYDFWSNCGGCDSVALILPDGARASAGLISATGVRWVRLLVGQSNLEQVLSRTRIEITELLAVWPEAEYQVRCGHLRISVPDSELAAQALTLRPVESDEAFFAAVAFRRVRYRLAVASCHLRGVDFPGLFNGEAYCAESLELTGPVIESLVNRDKPPRPPTKSPPMPHEALASIKKPFRLGALTVTDGFVKYAARRLVGAEPGVLTFASVQVTAKGIANATAGGQAIRLLAQGKLMDAATLTVEMLIPVASSALTFRYSGKLGAMDLTRLDQYLDGSGRTQIKSGTADEASFDIDVVDGHARGVLRGAYRGLQMTMVDPETGSEKGVANRVTTIVTNVLKVKNANTPDKAGALKEGKVDYTRKPEETFLQFAWLAVRSGILDLISL